MSTKDYKNRRLLKRIVSNYCYAKKQADGLLYSDRILFGAQISISETYGVDCPDYKLIENLLMQGTRKKVL